MSFESGTSFPPLPFYAPPSESQSHHIPSSFPVSLFELQQNNPQGPLLPDLSQFSGWGYIPTPPFEFQQLDMEMPPHQYQPQFPIFNYYPLPTQQFMNQIDATQQVPLAMPSNGAFAPPYTHRVPEDITIRGRVRRSTGKQRKSPYDRPPTPASSQASSQSSPASKYFVQRRLAVQGVCKINGCGQTFTSTEVYQDHVQISHDVKRGKNGSQILLCPWENCLQSKTESSLWNHLLGHSMKRACLMCHKEFQGDRSDSVKRHMKSCKEKGDSDEKSEGYIYFVEQS